MLIGHGATARSLRLLGLMVAAALGAWIALVTTETNSQAEIDANQHLWSSYDTTAPGVTSNAQERFCVVNKSPYESLDVSYWTVWTTALLNDPAGWEAMGENKNDFVPSCDPGGVPCLTVQVCIELWDYAGWPCPPAGACVLSNNGIPVVRDGHSHPPGKRILIPVDPWWDSWLCNSTCPPENEDGKRATVVHEMGHVMGEHAYHGGPEFGVAGDGGLWDGNFDYNPTPGEIDRFRAHLDGEPTRPNAPWVGFPANNRVEVSWFDTATDEGSNDVDLYRIPAGSQQPALSMNQGAQPGFGSRVTFTSGTRTDVSETGRIIHWIAQPHVVGGPRGIENSNTLGALAHNGEALPSHPCTLKAVALGGARIQLTWNDSSWDETGFAIYYQYPGRQPNGEPRPGGQALYNTEWQFAAIVAPNSEAFVGYSYNNPALPYVERVCAKVVALKGNYTGFDSNYACANLYGTAEPPPTPTPTPQPDQDGDGWGNADEVYFGTNPGDPCSNTVTANDEDPDAWPPDFDDNMTVNIVDVLALKQYIGQVPAPPRYDLVPDGIINIQDVLAVKPSLGTCS